MIEFKTLQIPVTEKESMSVDGCLDRRAGALKSKKPRLFGPRGAMSGIVSLQRAACSEPEKSFLRTLYYWFHAAGSLVRNIA